MHLQMQIALALCRYAATHDWGIFAAGAIIGGSLLRPGPYRKDSQAQPDAGVMAAETGPALPA
jgi:hypothetical protein